MATSAKRKLARAARRPKDSPAIKDSVRICRTSTSFVIVGLNKDKGMDIAYEGPPSVMDAASFARQLARGATRLTAMDLAQKEGMDPNIAKLAADQVVIDAEQGERRSFYGYDPHSLITPEDVSSQCAGVSIEVNPHKRLSLDVSEYLDDFGGHDEVVPSLLAVMVDNDSLIILTAWIDEYNSLEFYGTDTQQALALALDHLNKRTKVVDEH